MNQAGKADDEAELSIDGWIRAARRIDSPNFDGRPAGDPICLLVIHAISLPPAQFGSDDIERFFTNTLESSRHPYFSTIEALRVSAHFLIQRTGALLQFVSCNDRAWHAGASSWKGRERCNDFSIGIELEGCDELPFEDAQYSCLENVVTILKSRYPIVDVVGHSDISPGRKSDPGPYFEWQRLTRAK